MKKELFGMRFNVRNDGGGGRRWMALLVELSMSFSAVKWNIT